MLHPSSRFKFTPDLEICRILNGMWQVSGAHGYIEPDRGVSEMFRYHEAGFTTWDLADHYGPAEDFIGEFRSRFGARFGRGRLAEMPSVHQMGAASRADDTRSGRTSDRYLTQTDGRRLVRFAAVSLVGL